MKQFVEFTRVRFEIVLTTWTVRGGEWTSEAEAMKAVPAMIAIFGGELIKINRHEIPCAEWREI